MKLLKTAGVAALLGALLIAGGCGGGGGGDAAPVVTNPSATTSFTATANPNGTATTGANITTVAAPPGTPGYLGAVTVALAPNTVITAKNADGSTKALTATPAITFTVPADSTATVSGTNGVPVPTGFSTLTSTSGAIDVQIAGAASATFSSPITITMPVPGKAVGSVVVVYSVTGTTYTFLGSFTVTTPGFVSFPVTSLSWKVGDPNPDPLSPTTIVTTTVPPTTTTVQPTTTTTPTTITGSPGGTL